MITKKNPNHGFTLVELIIVIVVIAILAFVTSVGYLAAINNTVKSSLQSDLSNYSTELKTYLGRYGFFPTALDSNNCPSAPTVDTTLCLQPRSGSTLSYTSPNVYPSTYHLTETIGNISYSVTDNTSPAPATTVNGSSVGSACPSGFIPVPGSGTYGTNDFCVMKYAASHSDATSGTQGTSSTPISAPSVQQWVNVSQTTALADAPNVSGCSGCHLITDAEYLTIVQNVLNVTSNWSGGAVGSGYIYSGHNDNAPSNALVADPSDANGYAGETNQGGNQRRTLTLSNGQVIWDMAGNIWEWTQGTIAGGQQPGLSGDSSYVWKEWNNSSLLQNGLPINLMPAYTGISLISTLTSAQGIGQLYSDYTEAATHGLRRGGDWASNVQDGVLSLGLDQLSSGIGASLGFRVSR
jgi:general secretion pathway protein G